MVKTTSADSRALDSSKYAASVDCGALAGGGAGADAEPGAADAAAAGAAAGAADAAGAALAARNTARTSAGAGRNRAKGSADRQLPAAARRKARPNIAATSCACGIGVGACVLTRHPPPTSRATPCSTTRARAPGRRRRRAHGKAGHCRGFFGTKHYQHSV